MGSTFSFLGSTSTLPVSGSSVGVSTSTFVVSAFSVSTSTLSVSTFGASTWTSSVSTLGASTSTFSVSTFGASTSTLPVSATTSTVGTSASSDCLRLIVSVVPAAAVAFAAGTGSWSETLSLNSGSGVTSGIVVGDPRVSSQARLVASLRKESESGNEVSESESTAVS